MHGCSGCVDNVTNGGCGRTMEMERRKSRTREGVVSGVNLESRGVAFDVSGSMTGMQEWQGGVRAPTTDTSRWTHHGEPPAVSTPAEHCVARGTPPPFDPNRAEGGTESRSTI